MKYLIMIAMFVSYSASSEELKCKNTKEQTYSSCISTHFENVKLQVDNKYNGILARISKVSMLKELTSNLEKSHKNWGGQADSDCDSYAYFVEKNTPVYQDIYLQCKYNIYNDRLDYYNKFSDMINDFM